MNANASTAAAEARTRSVTGAVVGRIPSLLLIAVLCLVLLGIAAALVQTLDTERRARAQVEQTTEVLSVLRASLRAGLDAETGQRDFLLTNDPSYLVPYERGSQAWLPALDRLERAMDDVAEPEKRAVVTQMILLAEAKLDELARTIALARDGQFDAALALVRTDEGKDLMAEFRALVSQLEDAEETLLRAALEDASAVEVRTLPILITLSVAVVGLVVLGFWLERRATRAETVAREAEELERARVRSDLLARELNHRVKNLFAVILSIVSLTGRGKTDVEEVLSGIRWRIRSVRGNLMRRS